MRCSRHAGDGCGQACCLKIENLSVRAGKQEILKNIHMHVHCGEILTVIGPNGSGKTTLVRAILGQREHTGTIHFERGERGPQRPIIGYVPQTPNFEPGDPVSVLDLFSMYLSARPAFLPAGKKFRARVSELLARVQAEYLLDRRMGSLSGGELQRVLLALALEPAPHILILDEPVSGVDIDGQQLFYRLLDEVRNQYDLSVILITHDYDMIRSYADRVLLLDHTVVAEGSPQEVLDGDAFQKIFHLGEGGRD